MRGLRAARRGALRARRVLRLAARHEPPAAARPGAVHDAQPAARARRPARAPARRPLAVRALSACARALSLSLSLCIGVAYCSPLHESVCASARFVCLVSLSVCAEFLPETYSTVLYYTPEQMQLLRGSSAFRTRLVKSAL